MEKRLSYKEAMQGVCIKKSFHPLEDKLICNPDRWGKSVVEKNMFPVIPLIKWVDRFIFNNPATIPCFYSCIVFYVAMLWLVGFLNQ